MPLKKTQFDDYRLMQLQQNVDDAINGAVSILNKGNLFKNVSLNTTAILLEHKLGRVPEGWIVTGQNAGAMIWSSGRSNKTLSLQSSADVTIDVWVF